MATKLTKDVIRETDIEVEGKSVSATLSPDEGGSIKFRVKGARQESALSLRKAIGLAMSIPRTPVVSEGASSGDMVDLGRLEARIMMDGASVMTQDVKGVLHSIVREMREEMHEEAGLSPVFRGTETSSAKDLQDDSGD